jgi:integrase/recombinase XerC
VPDHTPTADNVRTIAELGEMYTAERKALMSLTERTAHDNAALIRRLAESVPGKGIGEVTRLDLVTFATRNGPGEAKATTKRQRLGVLRPFFEWLVDNDIIDRNPIRAVRSPALPDPEPRFLTHGEVQRLVAVVTNPRDLLLVLIATHMGLRLKELHELDIEDIDRVDRTLGARGKGYRGEVSRRLPIPTEVWEHLEPFLDGLGATEGPVFRSESARVSPTGPRLSRRWISSTVSKAMIAAGIKTAMGDGKSAHALRHTMAQHLVDAGADIRKVQAVMGHRQVRTTEGYARRKLAPEELRPVVEGRQYVPGNVVSLREGCGPVDAPTVSEIAEARAELEPIVRRLEEWYGSFGHLLTVLDDAGRGLDDDAFADLGERSGMSELSMLMSFGARALGGAA